MWPATVEGGGVIVYIPAEKVIVYIPAEEVIVYVKCLNKMALQSG